VYEPGVRDAVGLTMPAGWSTLLFRVESSKQPGHLRLWLSTEAEQTREQVQAAITAGRWQDAEKAVADAEKARPREAAWAYRSAARGFLRHARWLDRQGRSGPAEQAWRLAYSWYERLRTVRPEDEDVAGELAEALWLGHDDRSWKVLKNVKLTSSAGATLTERADGSIPASGTNPERDTYTIEAETDRAGITGLRLEVLSDPSLPTGGRAATRTAISTWSRFPCPKSEARSRKSECRWCAAPSATPVQGVAREAARMPCSPV
jgi:hypothetical protein